MNFIVIDKQSNLISGVVTSPTQPTETSNTLFIQAGQLTLDKYYRLSSKARNKGLLVDVGALAAVSDSFLDLLVLSDRKR